ncbi:MAG: UDP-N-acetylmuramate dehydrogenase [Chitinophagales bacterium]
MLIEQNKSLTPYNTFGIEASAKLFAEIHSEQQLRELLSNASYKNEAKLILGGGSNLLFTGDFNGLVIKNSMPGIEVVKTENRHVWIRARAGVVWHDFVLWTIANNYAGLENLSLIPGQVGAAPMQNIGAYGVEVKDVFDELEAIHISTGEKVKFALADCDFGYRESVFKNKYKGEFIISSVTFRLMDLNDPKALYRFKTDYGDIKDTLSDMQIRELNLKAVSDAVIKIRSSKLPDPKVLGNAGSFFKNPVISAEQFAELVKVYPVMPSYLQKDNTVKVPAGWLIEQCGWKGKRVGNTGSHARQALVLVNYGGAKGSEVLALAKDIQQSVMEKFGIEISPEVNVV